jgi:hypothetical protein
MKDQIHYYNDLIPPSNPQFPWRSDHWQLLCYYCAQPIYETTPDAGVRQRVSYMRGRWRHKDKDELSCNFKQLRPDNEIDDPRCHVCSTQTDKHAEICSVGGKPRHYATPMSQKEDEIRKLFGKITFNDVTWNDDVLNLTNELEIKCPQNHS